MGHSGGMNLAEATNIRSRRNAFRGLYTDLVARNADPRFIADTEAEILACNVKLANAHWGD